VPSVRIRRHTHRQEHRIPYTFYRKTQKTCQLLNFNVPRCKGRGLVVGV
jgi:hypothetical protein